MMFSKSHVCALIFKNYLLHQAIRDVFKIFPSGFAYFSFKFIWLYFEPGYLSK